MTDRTPGQAPMPYRCTHCGKPSHKPAHASCAFLYGKRPGKGGK